MNAIIIMKIIFFKVPKGAKKSLSHADNSE